MKTKKKILFISTLLLSTLISGCNLSDTDSGVLPSVEIPSSEGTSIETPSSVDAPASENTISEATSEITSEYPKDYFGKVTFEEIYVYDNDFDGIKIRPILSKPETASGEVFTYEVDDDTICEVENDCVYYIDDGITTINAKSEHLQGKFKVYANTKKSGGIDVSSFLSKAKNCVLSVSDMAADDTLFVGDSFFEFWALGKNITNTFNTTFADYKTVNIGISATQTHHWRAIHSKIIAGTEVAPKNIVINIGINNVDDNKEGGKVCAHNIQFLIEDYLEAYPTTNIYYFSITRCSGTFAAQWVDHSKSNDLIKEYCENTERVHYLDVMGLYGDDYWKYEQDGLHPNQDGYNLFEKLIKENVPMTLKKADN